MKLRSIPPRTCITLARENKLISAHRTEFTLLEAKSVSPTSSIRTAGRCGRMRQQISRKPFENKLSQLQDELDELTKFAIEGFDESKLEKEIRGQIERLSLFLGEKQ